MKSDWGSILTPIHEPLSWVDIETFEKKLGLELPYDYKLFLFDYNGGKVCVSHTIPIEMGDDCYDGYVDTFFPLKKGADLFGVEELRSIQEFEKTAAKSLVAIADDMGSGYYFLCLNRSSFGAIFYAFLDDILVDDCGWADSAASAPDYMAHVADSFSDMKSLILSGRKKITEPIVSEE